MAVGEEKGKTLGSPTPRPGAGLRPGLAGRESSANEAAEKGRKWAGLHPGLGPAARVEGRQGARRRRPPTRPGPASRDGEGRDTTRTTRPWAGLGPGQAGRPVSFFSFSNFCLKNTPRGKLHNFHPRTPFSLILDSLEPSQRALQDCVEKHHSPTRYCKNKGERINLYFANRK